LLQLRQLPDSDLQGKPDRTRLAAGVFIRHLLERKAPTVRIEDTRSLRVLLDGLEGVFTSSGWPADVDAGTPPPDYSRAITDLRDAYLSLRESQPGSRSGNGTRCRRMPGQ
jgi:hypothetical protein